jgi:hypothetical protein
VSHRHRPRSTRLGLDHLEERSTPTVSTISADFNGTPIAAGNTIWFNSAAKVAGLGTGTASVKITDATVSFTANGTAYTVNVPNTTVTFTGLATHATTTYGPDGWLITTPPAFGGNVFIGGAGLKAPSPSGLLGGLLGGLGLAGGFPGGIQHVTWTANFTADTPGLTVTWQWGAAVYTNFNTSPAALGVKAVDDWRVDAYANSDRAGTPENYKLYLTGGARGNGFGNCTGTYTAAASVAAEAPSATPATLSGSVYEEFDGVDGFSANDYAVAGVEVDLTGTDSQGNAVSLVAYTDASGNYTFTGLRPGTYSVAKVTPDGYNDRSPHVGTVNGAQDGSQGVASIMNITLAAGDAGINYNFEVYEAAY